MTYYNKEENKYYYEGRSMTRHLTDGSLWSGVPTAEQLAEWGFEPYVPTTHISTEDEIREQRMQEILDELSATDYLAIKAYEGEDMSEHEGWKEHRAELRAEYRRLENELANGE